MSRMPRRCTVALVCSTALLGSPAVAQDMPQIGRDGYRQGVPGVIVLPRPQRPQPPPESSFAAAYRRAGFPRLVLFFNRDLSDAASGDTVLRSREELTSEGTSSRREREQLISPPSSPPLAQGGLRQAAERAGSSSAEPRETQPDIVTQERLQASRAVEVSVQRSSAGSRATPLDEASQWLFETAFSSRMTEERVSIVDRASAIRIAAASATTLDPQRLEIAAVRSHADIVVLVRATAFESGSEARRLYRLTAIDSRNGLILSDDVLVPPAATDGPTAASATGSMAASTLIQKLTRVWSPVRP
jgi:hypothetical protein